MAYTYLMVSRSNQIAFRRFLARMRAGYNDLETKNSISKIVLQFEQFGTSSRLYVTTKKSTLQSSILIKG